MKIRKVFHAFEYLLIVCFYYICFPVAFLLYGSKHYWIIAEVDFDARDNGLHFFKYLNNHHKEINSVFVISKKNANYNVVGQIGLTVEPNSIKHFLLFIASSVKLSTLVNGCSPNSYLTKYFKKHHITGKNVALKHGVFKNSHPNYFKKNAHLDLICCAAKPEYEFVKKKFGYNSSNVVLTGLARFDGLHDFKTENKILIMPTWRRWLDGIKTDNDFKNSEFFSMWENLLNDKRLNSFLKQKGYKIVFYVHPKLNQFKNLLNSACNVEFLNSKDGHDLQEVLKNSSLLITDYSSIFFDFAYMKKPTIFFQFDQERFEKEHYDKGYFDYEKDGFGAIERKVDDVIEEIISIIQNNCVLKEIYEKRVDSFFTIRDSNNCQRIFDNVKKLL